MKDGWKIWDLPIRLFHWSLPLLLAFMWFSAEQGGDWLVWHLRGGLLLLALLVFRLAWGVFGSETARFSQFVKPGRIPAYLRGDLPFEKQVGHNPLGALMVLALLAALAVQVGTGLFAADENTFLHNGYLNAWVGSDTGSLLRGIHTAWFNLLLGLVGLHIAAVLFYRVVKRQNLVAAMITGRQRREGRAPELYFAGAGALCLAIGLAAAAAALVYWLGA